MTEYSNDGRGALWLRKEGDGVLPFVKKVLTRLAGIPNKKAPVFSGNLYAHRDIKRGEMVELAAWFADNDNERAPVLRLSVQDKREPSGGAISQSGPYGPAPDDDIPF